MKAVIVQYTVKESYAATNKQNIERVMEDLRALNNQGLKYSAFTHEDGRTFVHLAMYPDEETMAIVTELPSFKDFRMHLKASDPEVPPQSKDLTLVASAYDFF